MDNTVKTKFNTPQQEIDALSHALKGEHETLTLAMKKIHSQARELTIALSRIEEIKEILSVMLDAVDYSTGACRANEMVGAVLPPKLIGIARQALSGKSEPVEPKDVSVWNLTYQIDLASASMWKQENIMNVAAHLLTKYTIKEKV